MTNDAVFVSVARFADLVGLSERTCWNLIRRRILPVYRIGRRTLVRTREGVAVIEEVGGRGTDQGAPPPSRER